MLRLNKIYIENFKGISGVQILDFNTLDIVVLCGPNGFGKTTIFDAIELCLTGKISRTEQFKGVQKMTQNYSKAFYQNTSGKEVTIKLLFTSEGDNVHIIIKRLRPDHPGANGLAKKFRPDAWDILDTFYTSDPDSFASPFDIEAVSHFSQAQIDTLFFGVSSLSLTKLYTLFNYLQQEDNIYFIKKTEEEKKSELDFLFQTQEQAEQYDKIDTVGKKLQGLRTRVLEKVSQLGMVVSGGDVVEYVRLFPHQQFAFDSREPFTYSADGNISELFEDYYNRVSNLDGFVRRFSIKDYNSFLLSEKIRQIVSSDAYLIAVVGLNFIGENHEAIQELYRKRLEFERLLERRGDVVEPQLLEFLGFTVDFIAGYSSERTRVEGMSNSLNGLDLLLKDLIVSRADVMEKSAQLPSGLVSDSHCPMCFQDLRNNDNLLQVVQGHTERLKSLSRDNLQQVEEATSAMVTNYRNTVFERISDFLSSSGNFLDHRVMRAIESTGKSYNAIQEFISAMRDYGIEEYFIEISGSEEKLMENVSLLRARLWEIIKSIEYNQGIVINLDFFSEYFGGNTTNFLPTEQFAQKLRYLRMKYEQSKFTITGILERRLQILDSAIGKVSTLKASLDLAIKQYKHEMVERIKVPFYIYSGKILQNYQQGQGIFIDMQQSTSKVRFLTDDRAEHDIIHHLSSGQLAVVSIAFCLALNRVYPTPGQFRFIAIDDPVQTLDDVNVHSLIELLRHEFNDYQLLLSTHEDRLSRYFEHKFSKFGLGTGRLNVQKAFYPRT